MRLAFVLASAIALATLGCSGSGSPAAASPPATTLAPAPAPTPTPLPPPALQIPPSCSDCEPPVTNTAQPVRVTLRLYFVEDKDGNVVRLGANDPIPVGSLVHLDVVAKDAGNKETNGSSNVAFFFSDESLVEVGGKHNFQRKLKVLYPGKLDCRARLDGVDSNTLTLRFE